MLAIGAEHLELGGKELQFVKSAVDVDFRRMTFDFSIKLGSPGTHLTGEFQNGVGKFFAFQQGRKYLGAGQMGSQGQWSAQQSQHGTVQGFQPGFGQLGGFKDDRPAAIARLRRALDELIIDGIETSVPLFDMLLAEEDIQTGDYTIHWLEHWLENIDS